MPAYMLLVIVYNHINNLGGLEVMQVEEDQGAAEI